MTNHTLMGIMLLLLLLLLLLLMLIQCKVSIRVHWSHIEQGRVDVAFVPFIR